RYRLFTHTPTTDIYTLSLHDALPICQVEPMVVGRIEPITLDSPDLVIHLAPFRRRIYIDLQCFGIERAGRRVDRAGGRSDRIPRDRKSTRLNSSHDQISYAVFCLKKK